MDNFKEEGESLIATVEIRLNWMKTISSCAIRIVTLAGTETRSGRVIVSLHEIRFGDHSIVRGATSWCMAVQWGHEFKSGHEAQRVADEVERYMFRVEHKVFEVQK